jgi:predicted HicB family RNase H-like nuclease
MDTMKYKDFVGIVRYSAEDEVFHGKIEGIDGLVTFEAENSKELKKAFEEAVDDYIMFCEEKGINPYRSFNGTFNVRVKPELHRKAYQAALLRGISLNQIINEALEHEFLNTLEVTEIKLKNKGRSITMQAASLGKH